MYGLEAFFIKASGWTSGMTYKERADSAHHDLARARREARAERARR